MQRWNRTVIYWDLLGGTGGLGTTLPVINNDGKPEKVRTQKLNGIRAVSLPDRRGRIEVGMYPSISTGNHGKRYISERFKNLLPLRTGIVVNPKLAWGERTWPDLVINFTLHDGESFCDAAIDLVEAIFQRAGVVDIGKYHLGNFTLTNSTFVRLENAWISFVRWLRIQHRLPLDYVDDDRRIHLVEERDLL